MDLLASVAPGELVPWGEMLMANGASQAIMPGATLRLVCERAVEAKLFLGDVRSGFGLTEAGRAEFGRFREHFKKTIGY
ncbi:MAG: hypothetical protein WEB00_00545 [Dehalococcoidia bacterium]